MADEPTLDPSQFYSGLVAEIYRHLRSEAPQPAPYARFIARGGEPALELGCGDGDPLLDLRELGLDVEGLDASADMLERCQLAAADRGIDVVLHHATFESMDLGRRFRSIYLAGATFNLLPDDAAFERGLASIAAHLEPGGMALVPLHIPAPVRARQLGYVREAVGADGTIRRVTAMSSVHDVEQRCQTTVMRYELVIGETVHVVERPWVLHWVEQERFRAMVDAVGLVVVRVLRADGSPAGADDAEFSFLLARPR